MATLYDITGRLLELAEMASEEDIDDEVLRDTFEAVEGEFDAKAEAYCMCIRNLESDADAIDAEVKRLTEKKRRLKNTTKRMKATLKDALTAVGKKSAGGQVIGCSIRKNGGKLPLIVSGDPKDAPVELTKISLDFDKDAIREALDAGQKLDFAFYGERGESLTIK